MSPEEPNALPLEETCSDVLADESFRPSAVRFANYQRRHSTLLTRADSKQKPPGTAATRQQETLALRPEADSIEGALSGRRASACEQGFRSGGVGYIIVTDGPLTVITRDHARRLLQALAEERLPFLSANYTADCLMMSDDFEPADDAVAEAVNFVADDSRPPTMEETLAALESLATHPAVVQRE
jgi:hypothetical protein